MNPYDNVETLKLCFIHTVLYYVSLHSHVYRYVLSGRWEGEMYGMMVLCMCLPINKEK